MRLAEVLMVDDNPADADLTREYMDEAKLIFRLHHVLDGEEAIDFLRRHGRFPYAPRPDLILLELNLPRRDGRQVLAEIKQEPGLRQIPVVVLSASPAEADMIRSCELPADAYMSKPLDLKFVAEIVRSIEGFRLSVVKLPPHPTAL